MISFIRSTVSRIIGAGAAGAVAWLALPAEAASDLQTAIVTVVTLGVYGVGHKVLDALGVNPADDAGAGGDS